MNPRIMKKLSKRAEPLLKAYGWHQQFFLAEKMDNYSSHIAVEHPLKGTPMVGAMSGYYEPEWDEETAWDALSRLVYDSFTDWHPDREPSLTRELGSIRNIVGAAHELINERASAARSPAEGS